MGKEAKIRKKKVLTPEMSGEFAPKIREAFRLPTKSKENEKESETQRKKEKETDTNKQKSENTTSADVDPVEQQINERMKIFDKPRSYLPYWIWIINPYLPLKLQFDNESTTTKPENLSNISQVNESIIDKTKRDLGIFKDSIFFFLSTPVTIFGFPGQHLWEYFTRPELKEDFATHELFGFQNASRTFVQIVFNLFVGFFLAIIASIPIVCQLYQSIDELLVSKGLDPEELSRAEENKTEKWFFVNGICTDLVGAKKNSDRLSKLFGKPVVTLYNRTEGIFIDIIKCIFGRTFRSWPRVNKRILLHVLSALRNPEVKKVVLVGHSQGAIIVSNILNFLTMLHQKNLISKNNLGKLEVYTFGSPADQMKDANGIIYAEHFVNVCDVIPHMGVLSRSITYDGEQNQRIYFNYYTTGHFLNQHYLFDFKSKMYSSPSGIQPRLYSYLKADKPEPTKE